MRHLLIAMLLCAALAAGLSACGKKGALEPPPQSALGGILPA